jgi:hypothetical protein
MLSFSQYIYVDGMALDHGISECAVFSFTQSKTYLHASCFIGDCAQASGQGLSIDVARSSTFWSVCLLYRPCARISLGRWTHPSTCYCQTYIIRCTIIQPYHVHLLISKDRAEESDHILVWTYYGNLICIERFLIAWTLAQ